MKKFIPVVIAVLLLFGLADYKYTQYKYKDISYVVQKNLTTGFFDIYKLRSIDTLQLAYTDSKVAVVIVNGTQQRSPNKKVKYELILEKGSGDYWRVKKVYHNV
jgi:hypothetical protein